MKLHSLSPVGKSFPILSLMLTIGIFVLLPRLATGQIFTYSDDETGAFDAIETNMTATAITRGAGISAGGCGAGQGFGGNGWPTTTTFNQTNQDNNEEYFEFSITPDTDYEFTITNFSARLRRDNPMGNVNNGPRRVRYSYSTDNGVTFSPVSDEVNPRSISDCTDIGGNRSWPSFTVFTSTSKVIFRIYGYWGGSNQTGDLYLRNVVVSGTVTLPAFFRSKTSGDWNATTTWEQSLDGSTWMDATTTPDSKNLAITIRNTHTVTVTADVTIDETTVESGGTLVVAKDIDLEVTDGDNTDLSVSGTLENIGTVTVNGTIVVNSGGTYLHNQNGGSIPVASWNASSTCEISGNAATASGNGPTNGSLQQAFGNFKWNHTQQSSNKQFPVSGMTIVGNLEIVSTNSVQLRMRQSPLTIPGDYIQSGGLFVIARNGVNRSLDVQGNFNISGGMLIMCNQNSPIVGTLNLQGNFTQTGGNITELGNSCRGKVIFDGAGTQTFSRMGGSISNDVDFEISGTANVDFGTSVINGTDGDFDLLAGGTIITSNANGLGPTGTIQVGGTALFSSAANYKFEGAATGTFTTSPDANTVNNFEVEVPGTLTLSQAFNIAGILTFTSGKIASTLANLLTFNDGSSVSGNSATSFVDGPVAKVGAGDFIFPIGNGSIYGRLGITDLTASSTFTAQYFRTTPPDADNVTGLMRVSKIEYWTLDRSSGGDAKVTLYFEDRVSSGITSPGDLRVSRYDGSTWTNAGISTFQDLIDGSGSVTSSDVSSFSPFTFGANTAFSQ